MTLKPIAPPAAPPEPQLPTSQLPASYPYFDLNHAPLSIAALFHIALELQTHGRLHIVNCRPGIQDARLLREILRQDFPSSDSDKHVVE